MNRREFIKRSSAATVLAITGAGCASVTPQAEFVPEEQGLILTGTKAALEKSLYPAMREQAYPGHFMVTADGGGYGDQNTWPGLDSWQMAGAYLLVGRQREVLDYFDFVQASQRADGNIPFAIFPGDQSPGDLDSWLRGLRFPQDVYTYKPTIRSGQPAQSDMTKRYWIGLFKHWQTKANPLSVLGAVSYILTAAEVYTTTHSVAWLATKIPSLEAAGRYLLSRIGANGLMAGAGFYMESPPRNQWDGVTQCYGVHAFRKLAELNQSVGSTIVSSTWTSRADTLATRFNEQFWNTDHFAEYIHPEHGLVDSHGLSDVNWAAIGLRVATAQQKKILWPILTAEPAFWRGDLPTFLVTKPATYQKWELSEPLPFAYDAYTHDVAAMGRVWYLEALACLEMKDYRRLRTSVMKVCEAGKKTDWSWYERYHAQGESVKPVGNARYCEYPAILVRVVLGNPDIFPEAKGLRATAGNVS
jgi:hypothetical protein